MMPFYVERIEEVVKRSNMTVAESLQLGPMKRWVVLDAMTSEESGVPMRWYMIAWDRSGSKTNMRWIFEKEMIEEFAYVQLAPIPHTEG